MKSILAVFVLSLAAPARATFSDNGGSFAIFELASPLVAQSFPTYPLKAGQWTLRFVPSYMAFEQEDGSGSQIQVQDLKGFGLAAGVTYALSDHWGVSLTGAGMSVDGDGIALEDNLRRGDNKASGGLVALAAVFDPFSDPEGFRLPILVGVSYVALKQEYGISGNTSPGSVPSSLSGTRELNSAGGALGLSAQFNTGAFRWAPFIMTLMPLDDFTEVCTASGNANCPTTLHPQSEGVLTAGLEATYRPWNLGLLFVPKSSGTTIFSLKWQRAFGAD